jgi:hypothetical protein
MMHDPLIRRLASDGKVKSAATRGAGVSWRGSVSQVRVFSGFQYPTLPLEPLNGLQVASLLDHDEDLDTLLSRVAASSRLVIDAGPGDLP